MKIRLKWAFALIACLCMLSADSVLAQRQRNYRSANQAAQMAGASLASHNEFDSGYGYESGGYESGGCELGGCSSGSCSCEGGGCYEGCSGGGCCSGGSCCGGCGGGCLGGGGFLDRPGQFFIGADYLNVRSTFSESLAFVRRTAFANGNVTNQFNELEYDYESSYRIFGGYRLCECGGEILFDFTRFQSGASGTSGPGADPTNLPPGVVSIQDIYHGELISLDPNTRIDIDSNVDVKSYDLGFAKTIPLGSPACGGCDPCGSGCDSCCGWCPAWDIKWSAGIRFAEVDWETDATTVTTNIGQANRTNSTSLSFEGGGPRWGMEGRRYLGKQQCFSVFCKGDVSLLLGSVSMESNVNNGEQLALFDSTQIIPVLDIVAGGTFYLGNHLTFSAGYLFSAWHDLGMRQTFPVLEADTGLTLDDANILGFDGFFARSEFAF